MNESAPKAEPSTERKKPGPQARPKVTIEQVEALQAQVDNLTDFIRHLGSISGIPNRVFARYGFERMDTKEQGYINKYNKG